jgi:hypothetical protein
MTKSEAYKAGDAIVNDQNILNDYFQSGGRTWCKIPIRYHRFPSYRSPPIPPHFNTLQCGMHLAAVNQLPTTFEPVNTTAQFVVRLCNSAMSTLRFQTKRDHMTTHLPHLRKHEQLLLSL